jgi:dienelactone hydrolase
MTASARCRRHLVALATAIALAALAVPAAAAPVVPRLPTPQGQHAVGRTTLHLIDLKRRDPFKPVRPRELMATVTYPARHAKRYPRGSWFGRAVAQDLETSLAAAPTSLPSGSVDLVGALAHARVDAPVAQPPGWRARGWPVVLFSPGGGSSRELNTAQIEDLASRGYVVVSIDHTYEAPVVEFPGGRVARQVPGFVSEDPKVLRVVFKRAIDARVADTRFVLDRLAALERGRRPDGSRRRLPAGLRNAMDLSRVGMFGYSYGGYTAGEAMVYDRRIDAGVNLDGTMAHGFDVSEDWPYAPGEVVKRGLDRPFLLFGSTGHNHLGSEPFPTGDPSWQQFWANQRGWKLDLTLRGSAHGSFGDLQVGGPQIARGLGLPPATFEPLIGTIDPDRSIEAQRAYIASFFDLHLRGRDKHLLDRPSAAFPEIEFVR